MELHHCIGGVTSLLDHPPRSPPGPSLPRVVPTAGLAPPARRRCRHHRGTRCGMSGTLGLAKTLSKLQSPRHRGNYRRLGVKHDPAVPSAFQSPRHRGTYCGRPGSGHARFASSVSIPSSSGHLLRGAARGRSSCARLRFNPLVIGALTAGVHCAEAHGRTSWFQSPRHRGTYCGSPGCGRSRRQGSVSIPSSSGHLLRASPPSHRRQRTSPFQSPRHRGTYCG